MARQYCPTCEATTTCTHFRTLQDGTALYECRNCDCTVVSGDVHYYHALRDLEALFRKQMSDTQCDILLNQAMAGRRARDLCPASARDLPHAEVSAALAAVFTRLREERHNFPQIWNYRWQVRNILKDNSFVWQDRWLTACRVRPNNEEYKRQLNDVMRAAQALEDALGS